MIKCFAVRSYKKQCKLKFYDDQLTIYETNCLTTKVFTLNFTFK